MKTIFYADRIDIKDYPFLSCSLSTQFVLKPQDINEIRANRGPTEIVLNSGDIIFLDYTSRFHLQLFARINAIPQRYRLDVWSLLCEPFLDTEFDQEDEERTLGLLAEAGFTAQEVKEIRNKVRNKMLLFNSFVWEWVHLSHYDVLLAFGERNPLGKLFFSAKRKKFYDWCNQIANRAPEITELFNDPASRAELKLGDIAYALTNKDSKINFESFKKRLTEIIISSYTGPDRHYHNLEHVTKVAEAAELYQGSKEEQIALKLAAWFHDLVYDAQAADNEEKSLNKFLETVIDTNISTQTIETVSRLILLTKNHLSASTEIEKAMSDADMAIFAEDAQTYRNYVAAVRKEYGHLNDETFSKGRLVFLRYLNDYKNRTGKLFFNLQPMHETQAILNITNEIATLEQRQFS